MHGKLDGQRKHVSDLKMTQMSDDKDSIENPEKRTKALEVQIRAAREKAELWDAIIHVLREDYGVTVEKMCLGKT